MWMLIFVSVISKSQFTNRLFRDNPMLQTHSNQEYDHKKLHPPNNKRLEQLIE